METRPPRLVRLALWFVRIVGRLVPRAARRDWQREWESELTQHGTPGAGDWGDQVRVLRRSTGAVVDAAWLRRQFTVDSEWLHDVRHAWRQSLARPRFFLLVVTILAIGIGAATAVGSLLDRLVVRPLPFPEPHSLVSLWQHNRTTGNAREEVAPGNYLAWKAAASSFEALASAEPWSVDFTEGDHPESVTATKVSEQFFQALRISPAIGRLFDAEHFQAGRDRVVVISHAFWQRLGGQPGVIGGAIDLDEQPFTVLGVLPRGAELSLFDDEGERDIWLPKVFAEYERTTFGEGWWVSVGRLAPDVTVAQAQAEMDAIAAQVGREHPATNAATGITVEPLEPALTRAVRPGLTLAVGAVIVVLLIACANVANLLLVRGTEREQEFGLRRALGAGHGRILRQLAAESVFMSAAATIAGLGLAWALVRFMVAVAPVRARLLSSLSLDWSMVGIAMGVGVVTTLIFGAAPMLQGIGTHRIATGDRSGTESRRSRIVRDGLVVSEIAIAVALAVVVGLLGRSFARVVGVDPGFSSRSAAVVQIFAYGREHTPDTLRAFNERVSTGLRQLPGVEAVGVVSAMPLIAANINIEAAIQIEGRAPAPAGATPTGYLTVASPGYFTVMGVPVVAGRGFTEHDGPDTVPVVVISRTLARRHWPAGDAIGSWVTFRFTGRPQRRQIVGIVGEVRHDALDRPAREELFMPYAQVPFGAMTYVMRTSVTASTILPQARAVIWGINPRQAIYEENTVEALLANAVAPRRFVVILIAVFAGVALLLAAAGVYASMSVATARLTREFGIRLALGATAQDLGGFVIARGLRLGLLGAIGGLAVAALATRSVQRHLFGISAFDPLTIAGVGLAVVLITMAASFAPARRAMRVDAAVALRAGSGS